MSSKSPQEAASSKTRITRRWSTSKLAVPSKLTVAPKAGPNLIKAAVGKNIQEPRKATPASVIQKNTDKAAQVAKGATIVPSKGAGSSKGERDPSPPKRTGALRAPRLPPAEAPPPPRSSLEVTAGTTKRATSSLSSGASSRKRAASSFSDVLPSKRRETLAAKQQIAKTSGTSSSVLLDGGLSLPAWLWQALYPHQREGVRWLWGCYRRGTGAILADEMGLGKSVQIAAFIGALHNSGILQKAAQAAGRSPEKDGKKAAQAAGRSPEKDGKNGKSGKSADPSQETGVGGILLVCPTTLVSQWRTELMTWYSPIQVCMLTTSDRDEWQERIRVANVSHCVLLCSYETVWGAREDILAVSWAAAILDEGHRIRNPNADITITLKQLNTPHRIILSGSLIQNNLSEFWSLVDFVSPGLLGTMPIFENLARPILAGNEKDANQAHVAAAYQCTLALRELVAPYILRRTKEEEMEALQLPEKSEHVLFCNLAPEQYQVYVDFLQSEIARKAGDTIGGSGNTLSAISTLRKICSHPDLLTLKTAPHLRPRDLGSTARSGKMQVLKQVLQAWVEKRHRVLIFLQSLTMLTFLELWMESENYCTLRIDGKTPVEKRLTIINRFNGDKEIFALLLTSKVGGLGLNITGADKVVIFEPDWNPMTSLRARERAWRIGQQKEVEVYRLVLTGTLEEKVYRREVHKYLLSQKVLQDPAQMQAYRQRELSDFFELPPAPPNFDASKLKAVRSSYKEVFQQLAKIEDGDEDIPRSVAKSLTGPTGVEGPNVLQQLFDSKGLAATLNHGTLGEALNPCRMGTMGAGVGAVRIAREAIASIRRSAHERASHKVSTPTWTGKRGSAGAGSKAIAAACAEATESKDPTEEESSCPGVRRALKQFSKIGKAASESKFVLLKSERALAERVLKSFLDQGIAGKERELTTGQVLELIAAGVPAHQKAQFKIVLQKLCLLRGPTRQGQPGVWVLRKEFWPADK